MTRALPFPVRCCSFRQQICDRLCPLLCVRGAAVAIFFKASTKASVSLGGTTMPAVAGDDLRDAGDSCRYTGISMAIASSIAVGVASWSPLFATMHGNTKTSLSSKRSFTYSEGRGPFSSAQSSESFLRINLAKRHIRAFAHNTHFYIHSFIHNFLKASSRYMMPFFSTSLATD